MGAVRPSTACGFCRMLATPRSGVITRGRCRPCGRRAPSLTAGDRRAIAAGTPQRRAGPREQVHVPPARAAAWAGASVGDAKPRRLRGNQQHGERYHRNCRCVATAVRAGDTYEPPAYVQQWEDAYQAARKQAKAERLINGRGVPDPAATANLMDSAPGARRDPRSRFGQLVVLASGRRTGPIRHGRAGAVDHRPSAEVVVVVAAAHHQARRIVAACVLETTTNRAA